MRVERYPLALIENIRDLRAYEANIVCDIRGGSYVLDCYQRDIHKYIEQVNQKSRFLMKRELSGKHISSLCDYRECINLIKIYEEPLSVWESRKHYNEIAVPVFTEKTSLGFILNEMYDSVFRCEVLFLSLTQAILLACMNNNHNYIYIKTPITFIIEKDDVGEEICRANCDVSTFKI